MSADAKDPRLVTLNGTTYRLRKGEEFYSGRVQGKDGCTYVDGTVSVRTYKDQHGNTITACVHHSSSPNSKYNPSEGYLEHQDTDFNRANYGQKTASEHPTGRGSCIEAYESRNVDGSCNYWVHKSTEVGDKTQHITVQQKIPANVNQAKEKGRIYQAVRSADFQQNFGNTLDNIKYKGTFGEETYYPN